MTYATDDFDDVAFDDQPIPYNGAPTRHPDEKLPIADRVVIGTETGKHFAGGIVPFPEHLHAGNVLDALTGEERRKINWFISKGYRPTVYGYNDAEGRLIRCAVRLDHASEPKTLRQLRYCGKDQSGQDLFWFTDVPGTKPLYGLNLLQQRPDATVLIVEGEKAADAARIIFPDMIVITWPNGTSGVRHVDLTMLADRKIVVWPDNDPAGRAAARLFAARSLMESNAISAAIVDVPGEFPSKWDLADEPPPEFSTPAELQTLVDNARSMASVDAQTVLRNPERAAATRRLLGHAPGYSRVDPEDAAHALNMLDPDMTRSEWLRVARCWYHAFGAPGLTAFDAWSATGNKYTAGEPAELSAAYANEKAFRGPPLVWLLRYAARVAGEAQRNDVVDAQAIVTAEIEAMNESHAVVSRGGKTVVVRETFDPRFDSYRVEYIKKNDFVDKHVRSVQLPGDDGKPGRTVPLGRLWFGTARRREYDSVIFLPGGSAGPRLLNLWRGFTVVPIDSPGGWSRLKDHLLENVAQGNNAAYNYILNWLAFGVQHLDKPARTALVLTGAKGAGKSILSVLYGHLFGQHHFSTAHAGDVLGHFNAHLEYTLTLGLEEAVAPESRKQDSVFKDIINSKTLRLEEKFMGIWSVPNHLRIILTSNNDQVVKVDGNDRRYAVFHVTHPSIGDPNARHHYFGAMVEQMETGGYAAMLGELLTRDVSGWNAEAIPDTPALQKQKLLNLPHEPVQSWLHERLDEGVFIVPGDGPTSPSYRWGATTTTAVPLAEAKNDFVEYCRRNGYRGTERMLTMKLRTYMPEGFASRVERADEVDGKGTRRVYDFPPLAVARAAFTEATGIASWSEPGAG